MSRGRTPGTLKLSISFDIPENAEESSHAKQNESTRV